MTARNAILLEKIEFCWRYMGPAKKLPIELMARKRGKALDCLFARGKQENKMGSLGTLF
jgi:hypothetical protein